MSAPFIRVKDPTTGHEFDVREDSTMLAGGQVQHVKPKQFPPSRYPRPTKYRKTLPTSVLEAATDGVAEAPTDTTEESD